MNIHFKDSKTFDQLNDATLFKVVVGSHMYGTNDANSDIDYLSIYVPSVDERTCFYPSHHQLQYKKDNIDYNFCNIYAFLRNLLTGDSTINFEIINYAGIKDSPLGFLYDMRKDFFNYKIARSYNGLCRRDLRDLRKQPDSEKGKKLAHVYRGHLFGKCILSGEFDPVVSGDVLSEIIRLKATKSYAERMDSIISLNKEVDDFRIELTDLHNNKSKMLIPTFMKPENQAKLDSYLYDLNSSSIWKNKSDWSLGIRSLGFYEANENPEIKYD